MRNHFDIPFYHRVTPENVESSILKKLPINSKFEEVNKFIKERKLGKNDLTPCHWIDNGYIKNLNLEEDKHLNPFNGVEYRIVCSIRFKEELIALGIFRLVDYEIIFFIDNEDKLRLIKVNENMISL
jgi:hypothetical protein